MADQTTNYEFNLPEVDGSEDQWGDLLNQNWSDLDVLLLARDQSISALEARTLDAGDGLTGGGDLSSDPIITMGTPGTLNGGTSNNVTGDSHTHAIESTASRTESSTTALLQAAGMNDHRTSGDHDARYAQLAGGAAADFTTMPQVQGAPVVESGSNSDGEYVKLADGTLFCTRRMRSITTSSSASFSWTFPVESVTQMFTALVLPVTSNINMTSTSPSAYSNNTQNAGWYVKGSDGLPLINGTLEMQGSASIHFLAIGRWK